MAMAMAMAGEDAAMDDSHHRRHTPELDLNQVAEEDVKADDFDPPQALEIAPPAPSLPSHSHLPPSPLPASHRSPSPPSPAEPPNGNASTSPLVMPPKPPPDEELSPRNNGSAVAAAASRRSRSRSRSPRRRRSPPNSGRSTSRSPEKRHSRRSISPDGRHGRSRNDARKRYDSPSGSSRYRRSRSRSPYDRRSPHYDDRDYHRSRYSPRRRSPPRYQSRRDRSSRRRPWSPPPNRNTGIGKPGNNLFVAGFSFITTERDLEKKFSRYGRVTEVRIIRDRRSGDSRGFGFLSLERDEDADAAIRALDQTEWNGRIVLVEKAKTS